MPKHHARQLNNEIVPPISLSAAFHFADTHEIREHQAGNISRGRYGRYDNASWAQVERQLAALEGQEAALLFPSGMSAITSAAFTFISAGQSAIYTGKGYRNIRTYFDEHLSRLGIETHNIHQGDVEEFNAAFLRWYDERCGLVLVEMPSNPHLLMVDLEFIRANIDPDRTLLVVDSTFASPINFTPTDFGADLVIHSCTKYLGGHGDLMAGCVMGNGANIERLRAFRNVSGAIPDGFTAFLLDRSMATLGFRMQHFNTVGLAVATALERLPEVARVYYTGLPSHPHAALAAKYLKGHGGVISFDLDRNLDATAHFIDRLTLPYMGTNFGSHHSMVEQCAVFTFSKLTPEEREQLGISDSLIRLSVGSHSAQEILDDIIQALRA